MARKVFFATNRYWQGGDFRLPTDAQARWLWLGHAMVEGEQLATACEGQDDFATPGGSCGKSLDAFLEAASGALPLVSVHGFQFRFDEAVRRTAEIADWLEGGQLGLKVVPLLFTWPSSGALDAAAYDQDRHAAAQAGFALGKLFHQLRERGAAALKPVLLAHSSGAWALQFGVQAAKAHWPWPPLFRDALLAAADVADTALGDELALCPLARMAERVTALVYQGDPVLNILSNKVERNGPRLGADGPPLHLLLPANVRVLDVNYRILAPVLDNPPVPAGTIAWNEIGHQYYRNQPGVRTAMLEILQAATLPAPGWRPGQPWPGLGRATSDRVAHFYYYARTLHA